MLVSAAELQAHWQEILYYEALHPCRLIVRANANFFIYLRGGGALHKKGKLRRSLKLWVIIEMNGRGTVYILNPKLLIPHLLRIQDFSKIDVRKVPSTNF